MIYFLDTSVLTIPHLIHKLKIKYPEILENPIVISSISLNKINPIKFNRIAKKFQKGLTIWNYIDKNNFDLPINSDIKVLMTAVDYEKINSPDNVIFVTRNIILAHLANYYFGNDSILLI